MGRREKGEEEVGGEEPSREGRWIGLSGRGKDGSARFAAWQEFPAGEVIGGVMMVRVFFPPSTTPPLAFSLLHLSFSTYTYI